MLKLDTELDEESDDSVTQHEQNPGVDDGFFTGTREDDVNNKFNPGNSNHVPHDTPFPYAPGFTPNVVRNLHLNL